MRLGLGFAGKGKASDFIPWDVEGSWGFRRAGDHAGDQSGGCGGRRGAGGEQRGRSTELRSAGTGACCGHQLPRPEDAAIEGFEFQLPRPSPLRLLHDTGPFLQGGLEEEAKRRLPCLAWSWALRSPTSVSAAGRMLASAGQGHWFQPSGRPHK